MFIDKEHGILFEIGDFVEYFVRGLPRKYNTKPIRGKVTDAQYPADGKAGWYAIELDDGQEFCDYHYVFQLDEQRTREEKLNRLGI